MANKHIQRCSISLAIREVQVKTTVWYQVTSTKMVRMKMRGSNKCRGGCGAIRAFEQSCGNARRCSHFGKQSQKVKHWATSPPSNDTPPRIPEINENTHPQKSLYPNVHDNILIIAKTWKEPKCPSVNEQINKMWFSHKREYYLPITVNKPRMQATTWLNLENIIMPSETRRMEKDKYWMLSFICLI